MTKIAQNNIMKETHIYNDTRSLNELLFDIAYEISMKYIFQIMTDRRIVITGYL